MTTRIEYAVWWHEKVGRKDEPRGDYDLTWQEAVGIRDIVENDPRYHAVRVMSRRVDDWQVVQDLPPVRKLSGRRA